MSLFQCPVCSRPLIRSGNIYRCSDNHSFDIAKQGYVNLLPSNRMHSKMPGDDSEMVASRAQFLGKGYFSVLLDALTDACTTYCGCYSSVHFLDCGCGEGYYTTSIYRNFCAKTTHIEAAGIDISKFALRRAAKKCTSIEFAVASCYHLPVANGDINILTSIFAPLCISEFYRVMQNDAIFIYVVPSAKHLWQMKQVLYRSPYENETKAIEYPGFRYLEIRRVRDHIQLSSKEDIRALFQMTPYYWNTPEDGKVRLYSLNSLETDIGFDIHIFRKQGSTPQCYQY